MGTPYHTTHVHSHLNPLKGVKKGVRKMYNISLHRKSSLYPVVVPRLCSFHIALLGLGLLRRVLKIANQLGNIIISSTISGSFGTLGL